MSIRQLKKDLEAGNYLEKLIIFKYSKNKFLAEQYVNEISNILGLTPKYVSDINEVQPIDSIFETEGCNPNLYIYNIDKLETPMDYNGNDYVIIITANISKDVETKNKVVDMPDIENWQIKDYLYSNLEGIKTEYIDWLLDNSQYDLYRLQSEIDKFSLFNPNERNILFQKMLDDNAFDDMTKYNIWDISNCIVKKDISTLSQIHSEIHNIDVEPMALLSILYQNFRKLIMVWMNKNPIPDNTELTTKQIYAINKLPRVWDANQLTQIFKFLTEIDFKIKTGQLPMEYLRDYLIINIMSR